MQQIFERFLDFDDHLFVKRNWWLKSKDNNTYSFKWVAFACPIFICYKEAIVNSEQLSKLLDLFFKRNISQLKVFADMVVNRYTCSDLLLSFDATKLGEGDWYITGTCRGLPDENLLKESWSARSKVMEYLFKYNKPLFHSIPGIPLFNSLDVLHVETDKIEELLEKHYFEQFGWQDPEIIESHRRTAQESFEGQKFLQYLQDASFTFSPVRRPK